MEDGRSDIDEGWRTITSPSQQAKSGKTKKQAEKVSQKYEIRDMMDCKVMKHKFRNWKGNRKWNKVGSERIGKK